MKIINLDEYERWFYNIKGGEKLKDKLKEAKQEIIIGAILVTFGLFLAPILSAIFIGTIIDFILSSPLVIITIVASGVGLIVKGYETKKQLKKKAE